MPDEGKVAESRQKQSAASKTATLDLLKSKKRARESFTLFVHDDDGEKVEVEITFQSIGAREYDKLVGKHPPTAEQKVEGGVFNMDTFGPALIAKCSVDPEMSEKDAIEIWESPDWSRGDLMALFRRAVELNNRGVDIPFNASA